MGNIHLEVFVRVCVACIAVQYERFPLAREGVVVMASMKGRQRLGWGYGKECDGRGWQMMVGNVKV